jgi:uncharacterized protein (DUF1697 family)
MTACIALLRGVNVGRTKRLAMADLRKLVEGLGHTNVRTLLNSGNVVFDAHRVNVGKIAQSVEAAITDKFGFAAPVVVLTAGDLAGIILENPLHAAATDPSKHLIAFVSSTTSLAKAKPLLAKSWTPEALAIGKRAAYVWCARNHRVQAPASLRSCHRGSRHNSKLGNRTQVAGRCRPESKCRLTSRSTRPRLSGQCSLAMISWSLPDNSVH